MSSNSNTDLPILTHHVDKSQVPSIDQKRMLAFINHFILNTVDFLNKFIANCEAKFIEFDTKLQKVESSLLIVEAKLASMPDANESPTTSQSKPDDSIAVTTSNESTEQPNIEKSADESRTEAAPTNIESKDETDGTETIVKGIKITEDVRYRKYFKMLQMGVPAAAVKMKMQIEGFDGTMLDNPNRILEDGVGPDD